MSYASLQSRIESLRTTALSNHYTKCALDRLETYKTKVQALKQEATTELHERRDALIAKIQGHRDATVTALRERCQAVLDNVSEKTHDVKEAVQARSQHTVDAIRAKGTQVQQAIVVRKQQVVSYAHDGAETVLAFVVIVVANVFYVAFKVLSVVREAAPPKLVSSTEAGINKAKPVVEGAVTKASELDQRFLRGVGTKVTTAVVAGVQDKLAARDQLRSTEGLADHATA
jgi:ElaB/YqjD/DUF883 family membrane-anchored ribosome-binding protein